MIRKVQDVAMIRKVQDVAGREITLVVEVGGYTTAMHNNQFVCSGTAAQVAGLLKVTAPIGAVCFN
jgi:hypothetical protein